VSPAAGLDGGSAHDENSVMTTLPLADVKARLSAVLDDLAAIEETIDVLSTPGLPAAFDAAAAEIDSGDWVGADELARRYRSGR
jgi:hypothetical protein